MRPNAFINESDNTSGKKYPSLSRFERFELQVKDRTAVFIRSHLKEELKTKFGNINNASKLMKNIEKECAMKTTNSVSLINRRLWAYFLFQSK